MGNNELELKTSVITKSKFNHKKWERQSRMDTEKSLKWQKKISLNRERKAARILGFIMGSFIICWLPFFILYILQAYGYFIDSPYLFNNLTCLGYVNSALNPVIYTIFNIEFRKSFRKLLTLNFKSNVFKK